MALSDLYRLPSFAEQRRRMVQHQLQARGIRDENVLRAMGSVPREKFVLPIYRDLSYADQALPICCGQTISQPYTVAFMCEALGLTGHERVLEVGTGSGYGAAVLSELAREVHTVECIPELVEESRRTLLEQGYDRVEVHHVDGSLGLPEEAPFDAIVVTAAADTLPAPYLDQLTDGGRIVIPIGPQMFGQELYRFTWRDGRLDEERLGDFRFVPLVGQYGQHAD